LADQDLRWYSYSNSLVRNECYFLVWQCRVKLLGLMVGGV
jgi:hypothetical protein